MLLDTSIASSRSSGWSSCTVPRRVADAEAVEPEARAVTRAGWSANVVSASMAPESEAGGRGHQLEHRPGHVPALGRPVEQRRVVVLVAGRAR